MSRITQKEHNDPGKHNGVTPHLESDILEHEVKWALGSFTMNKASAGDGIPVELFQILILPNGYILMFVPYLIA